MSSFDATRIRNAARPVRLFAAMGMVVALAVAAGCTVRPLYGDLAQSSAGQVSSARLASVEVKPVDDRVGQEVRNHLIFMFGGGAGQPANPAYSLTLATTAFASSGTSVSTSDIAVPPTAGFVTVRTRYRLVETATGDLISAGTRAVQSPYDIPSQNYAAQRAVRDAQNRGARELAELLRLVIAQELVKSTSLDAPELVSSPEDLERRRVEDETGIFRPTR